MKGLSAPYRAFEHSALLAGRIDPGRGDLRTGTPPVTAFGNSADVFLCGNHMGRIMWTGPASDTLSQARGSRRTFGELEAVLVGADLAADGTWAVAERPAGGIVRERIGGTLDCSFSIEAEEWSVRRGWRRAAPRFRHGRAFRLPG